MPRILTRTLVTVALAAVASACINREVAEVEPNQSVEQFKDIPVEINRDIDILFVIDNSGSMEQEQASLQTNFIGFINVLSNIEGGLPNVHIGVVSTDVGVGPLRTGGCSELGDNGVLQNAARGMCPAPTDKYISDIGNPDGTRTTNYTGELFEVFGCIARLGTNGCGFEQPLESALRALDGRNPENQSFLRDSAFLAIIIISDEDDCSTEDMQLFDDTALGALSDHRCFEFGVICNPDDPRVAGTKTDCVSREDSQYLYSVEHYVTFFKGLKRDQDVIVAGIIGNTDPVIVGPDTNGNPQLQPSCQSASGVAEPGIRLRAFLEAFPQRNTVTTICNNDLSDALTVIAELLTTVIGTPCLDGNIQTDPLECIVSDVVDPGTDSQVETILPECVDASGQVPAGADACWVIAQNSTACPDTPTGLTIEVFPENRSVPRGTHTFVRCLVDGQ